MYTATALLALAATLSSVTAHVALWDKGLFGINFPDQVGSANNNYNNNEPVNPLRELDGFSTDQWFAHGLKGFPPKSGDFMVLPAGGKYNGEVQCNRAGTTLRDPAITWALPQYACDNEGPLHVMNKFGQAVDSSKFGGTALAIAYTSDVASLQPNDMTIISVNYNSVWERQISYDIPAGLPPCPEGGCLCTWNWIHQASATEGYGAEIYNTLYRCQVTGSTNAANTVQRGQVPRECASNSANCVKGPKTPMYIYQATGNNIARRDVPPNYRANWGFGDGAQTDIFAAGSAPAPTTYIDNAYATGTATKTTAAPTATATSLPSGWTSLGCMTDNPDTRALDGGSTSSNNMTIESCVASCASRGFVYAGVEYGVECHCGSAKAILNSAPASDCNVRCAGDQWSFCGGGYRMNMYRSPAAPTTTWVAPTGTPTPIAASALPTGWSALGCHVDDGSNRALGGGSTTSSNLTIPGCIASCAAKGMPYAGVEYGQECWCSPASAINLVPATDGCNVRCGGDQNTVCGGGYRINIFQNDALIPASSASSSASSTPVITTTSSTATPTTATTPSTTPATTTSSSSTSIRTSTTPSSTPSATSTTPILSASPSTSASWESLGCTSDSSVNRVLVGSYSESGSQTPQLCMAKCQSQGYTYAGLQYGRQCYCSNTMVNPKLGVTGCTTVCAGDKTQMCGGAYRMNIYGPASGSSSSSSASLTSSASSSSASSASSSSASPSASPTPTATGGDQIVYRTVTVTATVTVNTCSSALPTLTKRAFAGRRYPVPRNMHRD